MSVEEILEAVRALSPEERAQVRALLDTPPDAPLSPEEEAQVRLYAAGPPGETRCDRQPAGLATRPSR